MLPQSEPTAKEIFESHWTLVETVLKWVCRRHSLKTEEAEEFTAHACLKLVEDNYGVIRKFRGQSTLRTYLTTVISRLFLDFRTARWGKWRPSAAARRLGPIGIRLDRLIFRDGLSREEAVGQVAQDPKVVMSRAELTVLAGRLPAHSPRRGGSAALLDEWAVEQPADGPLWEHELDQASRRVQRALFTAFRRLPAEDRLLLRLHFRDDLSVARIAPLLRVEAKGLYRRMHRVFSLLERDLSAQGVRRDDVASVLAGHSSWLPTVVPGGVQMEEISW